MDEPLIYTSKGNLPIASLEERVIWTDDENDVTCSVEYSLDGECVRRQCNVYVKKGSSVLGKIGVI